MQISIHRNNYLSADTFSALVALHSPSGLISPPEWLSSGDLEVDIEVSEGQGPLVGLLSGAVDEVAVDLAGSSITLTGRDYTSRFIESLTAEKFLNLTSSQVVATLGARQGLNVQATATTTPTGAYYDSDHALVTNEVSEWTLLSFLAQRESFDIFVEGKTLCFQPVPDQQSTAPFEIFCALNSNPPVANVTRLIMRRHLTLARDVLVKIISWNHEAKSFVTSTRRAQKTENTMTGVLASPANYVFREPGLTQSQATALALSKLKDLTLHERSIEFELPGDLSLTPRSLVSLTGTGTDFDQVYCIAEMHITCTQEKGFVMRVSAKNSSPYSVTNS